MVTVPQFVRLNGRVTAFADLPKGTQDALIKRAIAGDQAIINVLQKGTGTSVEASLTADQIIGSTLTGGQKTVLIQKVLSNPNLSPREAIRLREKAINAGVENTNLHLGQATPEVIAQLQASRAQQNFKEKQVSLDSTIQQLTKTGIVQGNSSTRPATSKLTAQETFRRQQGFTKAVTSQVRTVLDSPEFRAQKENAEGIEALNILINQNVTPASKSNTAIINELSQAEIQGETQTARNIERILSAEGITTSVNVALDDSALGARFSTSESSSQLPQISQIQSILSGGLDTSGIKSIAGTDEPTILGLGQSNFPLGQIEAEAQGLTGIPIISDIGKLINDLIGLDINPTITGLVATLVPIFIILLAVLA